MRSFMSRPLFNSGFIIGIFYGMTGLLAQNLAAPLIAPGMENVVWSAICATSLFMTLIESNWLTEIKARAAGNDHNPG